MEFPSEPIVHDKQLFNVNCGHNLGSSLRLPFKSFDLHKTFSAEILIMLILLLIDKQEKIILINISGHRKIPK